MSFRFPQPPHFHRALRRLAFLAALLMLVANCAPLAAQSDLPAMAQWLAASADPPPLAPGDAITMRNWTQYRAYLPLSMAALFGGKYGWRMPSDVALQIGPAHHQLLPKSYLDATEKYGAQTRLIHLPDGRVDVQNYHGGMPFPAPRDPDRGSKILADLFWAYVPAIYLSSPANTGAFFFQDRYGNIAAETVDAVFRQSGWNTDPGVPPDESYAPGAWYTEWSMVESPEQSRYTALLSIFYKDQQAHPFPDTYVFVPSLRRSLRLSALARCSPVYGSDWTNDDAKAIGFNGGTSLFEGNLLGERRILGLLDYNEEYGSFPAGWDMPLGFPKPSWGKWEIRDVYVDDIRRIPSRRSGYCYGSRIMYIDKEIFYSLWNDLYDANLKLWKAQFWAPKILPVPGHGRVITNAVGAASYDLQNFHATYYSSAGNSAGREPLFNSEVPAEYRDGVKYGSPTGLAEIMK